MPNQLREIQAQKNLHHAFIIRLLKFKVDEHSLEMLIEYASKGDLFDYINSLDSIQEEELLTMFYKIVIAIDFIHSNGFIHRDIKPENILIGDDFDPKMADFGSSVSKQVVRNTFCGTYEYMAPEIYMREKQTDKIDIWALGILIFEMSHNVTPFRDKNIYEIRDMIEGGDLPFHPQISLRIRQIVWKILRIDPKKRPTAKEILMFPEFTLIRQELKHLIPKKNMVDRLNFEVMKGRILTMEEASGSRQDLKEKNTFTSKMDRLKEKARINNQLLEFKKNFRLPDAGKKHKGEKVVNMSNLEYDYAVEIPKHNEQTKNIKINIYENCEKNEKSSKDSGSSVELKKIVKTKTKYHNNLTQKNKRKQKSRFGKIFKGVHLGLYNHKKKKSKNITYLEKKRQKVLKYKNKSNNIENHNSFSIKNIKKQLTNYSAMNKSSAFANTKPSLSSFRTIKNKFITSSTQNPKIKKVENRKNMEDWGMMLNKGKRIESLNVVSSQNFGSDMKIISLEEQATKKKKEGKRHIFTKNDFLKNSKKMKNRHLLKKKETQRKLFGSEYFAKDTRKPHNTKKSLITSKIFSKIKEPNFSSFRAIDTSKISSFRSSRKINTKHLNFGSQKKTRNSHKNFTNSRLSTPKVDEYDFSFAASQRNIKGNCLKKVDLKKKDSTHDSENKESSNRNFGRRLGDLKKKKNKGKKAKTGSVFFGKFLERSCEIQRK